MHCFRPRCTLLTTPADPSPTASGVGLGPIRLGVLPWKPLALVLASGWVLGDSLDGPWSGALTVAGAAGLWWWLGRGQRTIRPRLPSSWSGWISRCDTLLSQFERLEPPAEASEVRATQLARRTRLEQLRLREGRERIEVGLAGVSMPPQTLRPALLEALRGPRSLHLHWGHPLPAASAGWCWPQPFVQCDLLLVWLEAPLGAAELRWLDTLPERQWVALLVRLEAGPTRDLRDREIRAQLPVRLVPHLHVWSGGPEALTQALAPLGGQLRQAGRQTRIQTELRCLEALHGEWQGQLEALRRERWRGQLQRTQWLVAAGVFAAPLPSVDLLVLAVANGLLLQEMARLWECPWGPDQLREAATELARAALALGITEWTSQSLLALMRLEGSAWLVGGALQALSAAYLTRVVGHAMADVLALSSGVAQADLAELRRQAPLLVARAADQEKLNWGGFVAQGRQWLLEQARPGEPGAGAALDTAS